MQIKLKLLPWLFVGLSLCLPAWAIPSPASGINYAITVVATDNSGNTTTSSVANVNVGTVVRIT